MNTPIKISKGLKKDLPQILDGQINFCTDTGELYIDNGSERKLISSEYAKALKYIAENGEEAILRPEDLTKIKIVRW